jgi:hypothetical protein
MKKLIVGIVAVGGLFCGALGSRPAQAQELVSGVNAAIASMPIEQQNAVLAQLCTPPEFVTSDQASYLAIRESILPGAPWRRASGSIG